MKVVTEQYYRSVITFIFLKGKSSSEVKELGAVYDDSSPSMAIVGNWFNEFQRGHMSICDEPHLGAPKTS